MFYVATLQEISPLRLLTNSIGMEHLFTFSKILINSRTVVPLPVPILKVKISGFETSMYLNEDKWIQLDP